MYRQLPQVGFRIFKACVFFTRRGQWISFLTSCHVYLSEQVPCSWFVKRAGVPSPAATRNGIRSHKRATQMGAFVYNVADVGTIGS